MSKLTDMLRSVGMFNAHLFYNGAEPSGQVYIAYTPATYGMAALSPYWTVVRVGYKTDPRAGFPTNGNKMFVVASMGATHAKRKTAALAEAQKWAFERYGIQDWKRDPFGSWGSAAFIDARLAELKAMQ